MNPYLSKGFAPLESETDIAGLAVEGPWPQALAGILYRIGPNPRFTPIEPYNPLLGDGMVHAFRLHAGSVSYRNRWVRTDQWRLEDAAGRALFATSVDARRHDPSVAHLRTDGVANTNLVHHAGRLVALEDGHGPIELDPCSLETMGGWNFAGHLPGNMTAHPKLDPRSGELILFANEPGRRFNGEIAWYVVDAAGAIVLERRLDAPHSSLVHDFAVTADFLVFLICPLTISLTRVRQGGPALAWEPERGTRVAVARRDGTGDVRWFEAPPAFVWHVLNAWNDGDRITVELCEQQAPAFPFSDGSMTNENTWRQRFARWQLEPGSSRVAVRLLSDEACEYPRFDERFAMQPTRHAYFACHGGPGTGDPFQRGIAHFDHARGTMRSYAFDRTVAVSEPVFVAASQDAAEGQGWLLCLAYDERSDRSHLAAFDAQRIEDGPVARALVPHRVPMGFHGCWVADGEAVR